MPDVRGLVGIDAGVLHQNFLSSGRALPFGRPWPRIRLQKQTRSLQAIEPGIDVSRSGDFKLFKSRDLAQSCDDLFPDLARRLAQLLGQLKAERQRVLAQPDIGLLVGYR